MLLIYNRVTEATLRFEAGSGESVVDPTVRRGEFILSDSLFALSVGVWHSHVECGNEDWGKLLRTYESYVFLWRY